MTKSLLDPDSPPRGSTDVGIIVIHAEADCTDLRLGELLGGYVANDLAAPQKSAFEEHMAHCIACDSAVFNWLELREAAQRLFRP